MQTQLFIENYELDISSDISSLITFEIDNIKEFSSRSTAWSKTIVLPGTARNNKLFGHIFQIGQSNSHNDGLPNVNYNFNAAKSASCILFQNQMQTFKGVLRLMQINIIENNIEYEVGLFGELASFSLALSGHFLSELDFSSYNHFWTTDNIKASWDATPGSGYFYPLIDYGQVSVDKKNYDIRAFRPALYVKEYIDKIFTQHNFRYSCDLFDTDRFKKLIIPHNKKELISISDQLLDVSRTSTAAYTPNALFGFDALTITGGFTVSGSGNTTFSYSGANSISGNWTARITGQYYSTLQTLYINLYKNGAVVQQRAVPPTGGTTFTDYEVNFYLGGLALAPGDQLTVGVAVTTASGSYSIEVSSGTRMYFISDQPTTTQVSINGFITMNDVIPANIRQLDFFVAIMKLFNLYVYEDKFDQRLLYIKPYVDFYSTSPIDAVDWSYKLNRKKAIKIRPMSELNAKTYSFRFKPDDDYYNKVYRDRYREGYGDYIYDSQYEFAQANQSLEIIFSSSVLVGYSGQDKIVSTLFKMGSPDQDGRGIEERTDTNIRIMQSKKIACEEYAIHSGLENWPGNTLTSALAYGYAGHFDDPDAPSNDIHFGVTKQLFFALVSGNPANTQFNVYWSSYMAEITDKDSKLLTAKFYLQPKDILLLDFSKKILIDGVLFRLNAINDYNTSMVTDTDVELMKINYLIY